MGRTYLKIRARESAVIIMMIGDSVTEPNIIANDSGLCVYICMQPHNTAQSENVLLWITTATARRYVTSTDLNHSAFTASVFYLH